MLKDSSLGSVDWFTPGESRVLRGRKSIILEQLIQFISSVNANEKRIIPGIIRAFTMSEYGRSATICFRWGVYCSFF